MDSYGASLALLGMHLGGAHGIPWSTARTSYYPFFAGTPTYLIDGTLDSWTGNPPWSSWDPDTAARLAIPTDVTIGLSGAAGAAPEEWHITANVCIEAGGTGRSMRIYIAQVLDDFPIGSTIDRNALLQVAATEDILLVSGACTDVVRTVTLDATSMAQLDDVGIIAWAQDDLATGPAEVFQARQMSWPFWTEEVFNDDFETGDTSGWTTTSP
jgi:hypothetical protein